MPTSLHHVLNIASLSLILPPSPLLLMADDANKSRLAFIVHRLIQRLVVEMKSASKTPKGESNITTQNCPLVILTNERRHGGGDLYLCCLRQTT